MESFLKTKKVRVQHVDREFEIRELSSRDWIEIMELNRNGGGEHSAALVCKLAVVGWEDETTESVERSLPPKVMRELTEAIYKLAGLDDLEKNSESVPKEGSSTVSLRSLG